MLKVVPVHSMKVYGRVEVYIVLCNPQMLFFLPAQTYWSPLQANITDGHLFIIKQPYVSHLFYYSKILCL